MLFFNYRQMGSTVSLTPTASMDSTKEKDAILTLNNAKYRYAYLTKYVTGTTQDYDSYDTGYAYTDNDPTLEWNMGTILYADFSEKNLSAGNINHLDSLVKGFILKRRTIGDTDEDKRIFTTPDNYLNSWIPILYREDINGIEGLNFKYEDVTAPLGQRQEYDLILILKNGTEQLFASAKVTPSSERIVVLDHTGLWATCLTDGFCDSNRVYPVNVIAPLFSRQPTIFRNSLNNYETVSVSGNWLPFSNGCCGYIPELDDKENTYVIVTYRREFVDFLTNNEIKLVKNVDGRMWLGFVTSDVADSANGTYNVRNIAFTLTENGNCRVARDLCEAGLIDKNTEEWW